MTGNKSLVLAALALALISPAIAQQPLAKAAPEPLPDVNLQFGSLSGSPDDALVISPVITYGGEMTVRADKLQGNLLKQSYAATGNVRVHETDTTLSADSLTYDAAKDHGSAAQALLVRKPFVVRAKQINLDPDLVTAFVGRFSTGPLGTPPDLEARFGDLSIVPTTHNAVMHNAAIYLFRAHLLTVRRLSFNTAAANGGRKQSIFLPVIGASARYGPFFAYKGSFSSSHDAQYRIFLPTRQAPQLRVTDSQVLLQAKKPAPRPQTSAEKQGYLAVIRQLATIPEGPLPDGDPLLFHGFLPDKDNIQPLGDLPTAGLSLHEELSTRNETSGNRISNLYVSRLPEINLAGSLPITRVPSKPTSGDPSAYRTYLKHVVLIADASTGYGYFQEQPDNIHAARQRDSIGVSTQPILIGPNTLFQPSVNLTTNFYSGRRQTYHFLQASVEVNHYYTPYSAVSVQYLQATTGGQSPFNFDVLDTSKELRSWVQVGNRRLAVAGEVRYDVTRGGIFDYKFAIAPGLAGITPVLSYDFQNGTVGVGVDIPGLTF